MNSADFRPITNIHRWAWQDQGVVSGDDPLKREIILGFDTNGDPEGKYDQFVRVHVTLDNPEQSVQDAILRGNNSTFNVLDSEGTFDGEDIQGSTISNPINLEEPPPGYFINNDLVEVLPPPPIADGQEFYTINNGVMTINGVPHSGEMFLSDLGVAEIDFSGLSEAELQRITTLDISRNGLRQIPKEIPLMRNIENLNASSNLSMQGDLQDLNGLNKLASLSMSGNSHITGNVADLPILLKSVDLSFTSVGGNIGELPPFLTSLQLISAGDLEGDIETLPQALTIVMLSNNSRIQGDISTLPPNIDKVLLANTRVGGDIGSVPETIGWLYVEGSRVSGDISSVTSKENMTRLSVDNTGITGDVSALQSMPQLTFVNLSHTQVSGVIEPNLVSNMANLTHFFVNNSAMGFSRGESRSQVEADLDSRGVTYDLGGLG